jgi:glyoxylase-like metal-dependent hydrolase (beta-lactamase superfamily II)/pimeloyl-ACP methyl ester carboxylesterase
MDPWITVAPGVHQRRYDPLDVSIVVVEGAARLLVVDSRAEPAEAEALLGDIRERFDKPVRWLVNTHAHYDHTFGNQVFGPGSETDAAIYGHANIERHFAEHEAPRLAAWRADPAREPDRHWSDVRLTPPTHPVDRPVTLDLGGRVVLLRPQPPAHTDTDLVLLLPDVRVWIVGDLVEESGPPMYGSGSFPFGWPDVLDELVAEMQPGDLVVPGHGRVVGPEFVARQAADLHEVAGRFIAAHELGLSASDALASHDDWPVPVDYLVGAIDRAYAQLDHVGGKGAAASTAGASRGPAAEPAPFTIRVPEAELRELRDRLRRTRFTTASSGTHWGSGVDPAYLAGLVAEWADGFDWRGVELRLNRLDHRIADVDGTRVHFVRATAGPAGGTVVPLLLMHGWPSSFLEMLPLVTALGWEGEVRGIRFELIIPSLPGFLYSELPDEPLTREAMADLLHELMARHLGHERYGVFGGDIGGTVAAWIAAKHPRHVMGLYMIHPPFPAGFEEPLSEPEKRMLALEQEFDERDGGYSAIMSTRPDTIAAALADSPAGLLAWIIDKLRDWSDAHGELERRFDHETLLTLATLYWTTGSIGTSFRQYVDYPANRPRPRITVPAGFTLSAEEVIREMPRSVAERSCADVRVWHPATRGGHFMAHEEPELLAGHLSAFFAEVLGVD